MADSTITVVVVDDQWMIREGLASLAGLDEDIEVVATGSDGNEAVALAEQHRPNVVLMDIRMPGLDGIEAARRVRSIDDRINVLMLTTFEDRDLIERSLNAGAAGYLTKDIAAADLANSIRSAAAGVVQLTPNVTQILLDKSDRAPVERRATSDLACSGVTAATARRVRRTITPRAGRAAARGQGTQQPRNRREATPQRRNREEPRVVDPASPRHDRSHRSRRTCDQTRPHLIEAPSSGTTSPGFRPFLVFGSVRSTASQ